MGDSCECIAVYSANVTILDVDIDTFDSSLFQTDIASQLDVLVEQVVLISVKPGSVAVEMQVRPVDGAFYTTSDFQVMDETMTSSNLTLQPSGYSVESVASY